MERQLAAIMFTDIVGYSAMMGQDEEMAFELLHKNRQIQKPLIERFGGRWLKEIGDGVLASFGTISQAVHCAWEIQRTCRREKGLKLRIGIHEGEVLFEENDVFGDGVNIASRLQSLAPEGRIWVSESVHQNLLNKKDLATAFVKKTCVKNGREAIRVFEVRDPRSIGTSVGVALNYRLRKISQAFLAFGVSLGLFALAVLELGYAPGVPQKPGSENPSMVISILPFSYESGEETGGPLAEGLRADLVDQISKIGVLDTDSKAFCDPMASTMQVRPADLFLKGILESGQDELRVKIQLIDAETMATLWTESYVENRNPKGVWTIERKIILGLAEALNADLRLEDWERLENIPAENWPLDPDASPALRSSIAY